MVTTADIRNPALAAQIYAVQRAAYAIEAMALGCADFPPLRETLANLQQSRETFLIFVRAGRVIGSLSYEESVDRITINRLVVSPDHFRQGVASALLQSLTNRLLVGTRVCVSTAQANHAAVKLYQKHGFTVVATTSAPEAIMLMRLCKIL